jgi:uncharacterized membrane protein YhaH (DUF805 family)
MMTFEQAIRSGFYNYAKFSGRAVRSEFWYWTLFMLVGGVAAKLVDVLPFHLFDVAAFSPLSDIFWLVTFVPQLAVTVRRLHDVDRSGWWYFLGLVPLVGVIVLMVWWCTEGTHGYNRFGADPQPPEPGPRHRVKAQA